MVVGSSGAGSGVAVGTGVAVAQVDGVQLGVRVMVGQSPGDPCWLNTEACGWPVVDRTAQRT